MPKIEDVVLDAKEAAAKLWIRSKTIWFNLLAFVGVGAEYLTNFLGTASPKIYAGVAVAIAAVNFVLRWVSTKAIKLTE